MGTTLSGGEQQMLAIARVLAGALRRLLIDEHTEGLAPMIVEELFLLIGQLAREGIPIVLVEQNVRQAIRLTTRYYLIERGRVVAQGDCSNDVGRAALLSRISVSDGPAGLGGGACGQQWHGSGQGFTAVRHCRGVAQTPGPPDGGAERRGKRRRQD